MATTQVRTKQQLLVSDNLNMQSFRITSLADPTSAQDAATKAYVDALKTGLDIKDSVRIATTGAESYTISGGAVTQIAGTSVDGVTMAVNDRILIKNAPAATGAGAGAGTANTTQPGNGIYVVTNATTNLTLSRATDADASVEVTAGLFCFVVEGTANADNGYVLTTNDTITLNATGLNFTQFSGAGQITAGAGLTKTANTIDVVGTANRIVVNADSIDIDANYAGQNSIVTLGTVSTGTWSASTIATTRGGTGLTAYTLGDIIYSSAANTLATLAGNTTTSKRFLNQTGNGTVSAAPVWSAITAADVTSGAALTKTDDTNVTLTLGGTPASALLAAASITVGWTGTLSIARGGTGASTKTAAFDNLTPNTTLGDVSYHNGTDEVRLPGNTTTTKQFLSQTGTGTVSAAPAWAAITGADVTGAALTSTNDTNVTITLGGTPATSLLRAASITLGWTGTLAVGRGGTGASTFTAYMPIVGGTTSTGAVQSVTAGTTTGQALLYQGTASVPTFGAINLAGGTTIVSGTLPAGNGGTGQSAYTIGDILYADTSTSLAKLLGVATGNALISGGVGAAPSWGKVGLTTHVSGTLAVGNGGTGLATTPTNGQLLIGNGTNYTLATLTQGTNISITNAAGSITIAVTGVITTANKVTREVPTGTINGTNATFTLANTPVAGTEDVYVNGVLQNVGTGNDYTIATNTITFLSGSIPQTGDTVLVSYFK